MDWGTFITGGLLGALATVIVGGLAFWHNSRDLGLRTKIEHYKMFMEVSRRAHGYAGSGEDTVGIGEQIAALHLLADITNGDPSLRHAGAAQLDAQIDWYKNGTTPTEQVERLFKDVVDSGTVEAGHAAVRQARVRDQIQRAAEAARARIKD
ncbi:hypothetical protein AS188_15295 [Kocuria flava]|uniref:Chemotaxis protein n=1 Tax=Kocuria flava TaxID=446860 RepID=A0A0U3GNU2_9MICC|nr:hypothetical protein [Kocuria flava]ALU40883.1 hypothetical protein AS188_15295 [Kocuria flava]GEO91558.1 hypothetical protein KFL01_08640 [Kocuria flava]